MVIKETPWERRNLGVNGVEFYFDTKDTVDQIETAALLDRIHDYQVAHLPIGRMDLLRSLAKGGFDFVETKFALSADLKTLSLPRAFLKYEDLLAYHPAGTQEMELICSEIKKGIFDTDKISLDPVFGKELAGKRYALWTADNVEKGTGKAYIVEYRGNNIGFFITKEVTEKVADSFLAALFSNEKYLGLGFSVLFLPMLQAKKEGKRRIITGVSSNNPASLRLHLSLGYEVDNIEYVMVKHLS